MANFWSNSALEPKRQFRFLLQLSAVESYVITKVNRPSFEIGESQHKFINHTFYYPGRVTWNDVTFSMVDAVLPDSTGLLMKMLMASGYRFPSNSNDARRSISKTEAVSAVGDIQIHVLGHSDTTDPTVNGVDYLESWTLKNPWIKSVNMGDLSYDSDDLISIDVTLKYDWATLNVGNADFQIDPKTGKPGNLGTDVRLTPKDTSSPLFKVPSDLLTG